MKKSVLLGAMILLVSLLAVVGTAGATNPNPCPGGQVMWLGTCQDNNTPITICHAAGQAGTTQYTTLNITLAAVVGAHFDNNGSPTAGHELDTLGPCAPAPIEVTASVTFTDPTCEVDASYTATPVTGVTYTLTAGTVGPGNTITVTATAATGYVLVGQTVFTHTFAAAPTDCEEPDPIEVTAIVSFTDPTCDSPTAAVVTTPVVGITYETVGTVAPGGSVTVTATADEGYVIVGQAVFEHTFGTVPTNCGPPPPPRCPPGEFPTDGKDGEPGNEECEPPGGDTPPASTPPVTPPAPPAPPAPPTPPAATPPTTPPAATPPPPKVKVSSAHKPPKTVPEKPRTAPEAPPATEPVQQDTLPYTGLGLGGVTGLGALLVGLGLLLRRRTGLE